MDRTSGQISIRRLGSPGRRPQHRALRVQPGSTRGSPTAATVHSPEWNGRHAQRLDREVLNAGAVAQAHIMEQPDTTTVIPPRHRAHVDRVGNLNIQPTGFSSPLGGEAGSRNDPR